jgi:hypothetical protein
MLRMIRSTMKASKRLKNPLDGMSEPGERAVRNCWLVGWCHFHLPLPNYSAVCQVVQEALPEN